MNPGNLNTGLQRHMPVWQAALLRLFLHTPIYGAYTELYAGLSPDVTIERNGAWSKSLGYHTGDSADSNSCTMGTVHAIPQRCGSSRQARVGRRDRHSNQILGLDRRADQALRLNIFPEPFPLNFSRCSS